MTTTVPRNKLSLKTHFQEILSLTLPIFTFLRNIECNKLISNTWVCIFTLLIALLENKNKIALYNKKKQFCDYNNWRLIRFWNAIVLVSSKFLLSNLRSVGRSLGLAAKLLFIYLLFSTFFFPDMCFELELNLNISNAWRHTKIIFFQVVFFSRLCSTITPIIGTE